MYPRIFEGTVTWGSKQNGRHGITTWKNSKMTVDIIIMCWLYWISCGLKPFYSFSYRSYRQLRDEDISSAQPSESHLCHALAWIKYRMYVFTSLVVVVTCETFPTLLVKSPIFCFNCNSHCWKLQLSQVKFLCLLFIWVWLKIMVPMTHRNDHG